MALPPIMTILWAGMKNLSPREMVDDPELTNMIEYMLRFHLGAVFGMASVTKVHGSLTAQFGISYTDQKFMNEELDGLIGASVYCVHTLNACLGACDDEHADIVKRMETVNEQAKLSNDAFKTMEGSTSRPNTTSTTSHLAKTWL